MDNVDAILTSVLVFVLVEILVVDAAYTFYPNAHAKRVLPIAVGTALFFAYQTYAWI